MPSSRASSQSRDQHSVSCISCNAGGFFTTEPPGKRSALSVYIYIYMDMDRYINRKKERKRGRRKKTTRRKKHSQKDFVEK